MLPNIRQALNGESDHGVNILLHRVFRSLKPVKLSASSIAVTDTRQADCCVAPRDDVLPQQQVRLDER